MTDLASPCPTPPVCRDVSVISIESHLSGSSELFTLRLAFPGWEGWLPGQFVMIRPEKPVGKDFVWGRPFSISFADSESLTLVIQTAGRGTRELQTLRPGEKICLWGPLGNAFALSQSGPTLLLAGGIGLAPFVGYIARHPRPESLRLEFGHRLDLACYPFADCSAAASVRNHHERCPEDLPRFIAAIEDAVAETARDQGLVLACGPMPFLRTVQRAAFNHGVPAQLSLETRMACGVGACLGCVVKVGEKAKKERNVDAPPAFNYVQTCSKGPVFWADQLDLS